jgi:DNA replication and repair protein RecF
MTIQHLTVVNCRNIESATITPGPFINVFIGDNGSGKTSLLESIYLLGLGRSFRTTLLDRVIRTNATSLMTVAKIGQAEQPDEWLTLGMQRILKTYQNWQKSFHYNYSMQIPIDCCKKVLRIDGLY